MKLEQSFEVDAPLERVWNALIDVERVAPCLPGAAVTGRNDDGTYNGTFTIKIGPTTASYTGRLEMQNVDEATHRATMHAQGSDRRGQGGATATIVSTLSPADGATKVEVVTDYHITGRLARFGRGGMIEDISERLLREFASRLQSSLASGGAGAAVSGVEASGSDAPSDEGPTAVHSDASEEASPPTEVAAVPMAPPAPPEPAATPEPAEIATEIATQIAAPSPPPPPPTAAAAPPPPSPEREEAPPPPPPVEPNEPFDAGSLVGSVVVERVKRNLKPVIAVAGGLLLLRLVRRRR